MAEEDIEQITDDISSEFGKYFRKWHIFWNYYNGHKNPQLVAYRH